MKNRDKVTLTVGQLKKLVKESSEVENKDPKLYNAVYDVITNYIDKVYNEDMDYIDWIDSELYSHEDEIKKHICNMVTEIADDIFHEMYMDV